VKVAEQQIDQTSKQIERTSVLIESGKLAKGALLELEAQLSREKLELVNRQNTLQIAYLNLAQLLELENYEQFDVVTPELPELHAQVSLMGAADGFNQAVENRSEIKSANYKLYSAQTQLDIAKGGRLPVLSASAGIYDQYFNSSQADVKGFFNQLGDNHRESIGLNLSIPVYDRNQNKTNIANAQLQVKNQQLQLEGKKKELRKTIEQAYVNAQAAFNRYKANKAAVASMQESFRYIEEKYNVGLVNSVEYNDVKTKLAISESDLIQAKYEFIFRSKILDFYSGVPISL
jgi:outer membrane protein